MILYDTDIFSIMQRGEGEAYSKLIERVCLYKPEDIKITIISFEEQTRGWLDYLAKAKTLEKQIVAYSRLEVVLTDFSEMDVLPFDKEAAFHFDRLRKAKIRIGTLDLKIASIVLAHAATLVSRNLQDFSKVPGLKVEDWTKD